MSQESAMLSRRTLVSLAPGVATALAGPLSATAAVSGGEPIVSPTMPPANHATSIPAHVQVVHRERPRPRALKALDTASWQLPVDGQEYELAVTINVDLTTYGPEYRRTVAAYVLGGAGREDGTWRLWMQRVPSEGEGLGDVNPDLIDIEDQTGPNPMHHLQALLCGHLAHDGEHLEARNVEPVEIPIMAYAAD